MTIFSRHISVMRRVCVQTTGISSLPATASALSGTPSPRLRRGSGKQRVWACALCLSECVWFLSFVFAFGVFFLFSILFVCLCGRSHLEAGGYRPSLPCEAAAKKPGVCSILLQPLWRAARPEVAAGASASLAHKVRSSGHREGQQHGST